MSQNQYNKILVIRFSSLGDVILTTPLLKILRKNFPSSQIDYCTKLSYGEIIKYNPNINNIIEVSDRLNFSELKSLQKKLKKEHYDCIIDLHHNLRTFYLKLFLRFGAKICVFKKYSLRKFLLVKFKINLMKDLPSITQRYINSLKGIIKITDSDNLVPEIFTSNEVKNNFEKLINDFIIPSPMGRIGGPACWSASAGRALICIVPSSKHFTKSYPIDGYINFIDKFDKSKYKFVLAGKGYDKVVIFKIKSQTGENVFDLSNKLSLLELTELMKRCDLIISGDTGPMHIAESVGKPLIMLAGSSVKEFGFYPITSKFVTVLEVNNLPCRPCSHIGRETCPKKHFKCMKEIKPETVFEEAMKMI